MSGRTRGGLIDLGGSPNVRVSTTDDDGDLVFVATSVYDHTTEADRRAMADAAHLYPAPYDYVMSDFPMTVVG